MNNLNAEANDSEGSFTQNDFTNDINCIIFNKHNNDHRKSKELINIVLFILLKLIILYIAIYCYIAALEGCPFEDEGDCYRLFFKRAKFIIINGVISCVCFIFVYVHAYFKKDKYSLLFVISTIIIQSILIKSDLGNSWQKHGLYNAIVMTLAHVIILGSLIFIHLIYKIFKKLKKKYITVVVIIVTYLLYLIILKLKNSCKDWEKGFKNTKINDTINCRLSRPNVCFQNIINSLFEFKNLKATCKDDVSFQYNEIITDIYKNSNYVVFPDTKTFNPQERLFYNVQDNILKSLKLVNNTNELNIDKIEVLLNRTDKDNPKFIINVPFNQSAAQRAREKDHMVFPYIDNILIFFFDTISRVQFKAKMPKVYKWIEEFYENKTSPTESYQFFKYHATHANTYITMNELMLGIYPYFDNDPTYMLHSYYKESGFITGHSLNECSWNEFNYQKDYNKAIWEDYDHEMYSLFCDPSYITPNSPPGIFNGIYSLFPRCLYKKNTFEYILEFGEKFIKTYKDYKKYLLLSFIDGHEFTNNVIKQNDEYLHGWLLKNQEQIFKSKTALIFISDHGQHLLPPLDIKGFSDLTIEKNLPNLHILLPRELADAPAGKYLKDHENILIGNFDLNAMLKEMSGVSVRNSLSNGLFRNPIQRFCSNLLIKDSNCFCRNN